LVAVTTHEPAIGFRIAKGRAAYTLLPGDVGVYGFGDLDIIDTEMGPKAAVRVRNLQSGWRF
jgi:hypothetical protein